MQWMCTASIAVLRTNSIRTEASELIMSRIRLAMSYDKQYEAAIKREK